MQDLPKILLQKFRKYIIIKLTQRNVDRKNCRKKTIAGLQYWRKSDMSVNPLYGGINFNIGLQAGAIDQRMAYRDMLLQQNAFMPVCCPSADQSMALMSYYNNCLGNIDMLRYGFQVPDCMSGMNPSSMGSPMMQIMAMSQQNSTMNMMMYMVMAQQIRTQQMLIMMVLMQRQNGITPDILGRMMNNNSQIPSNQTGMIQEGDGTQGTVIRNGKPIGANIAGAFDSMVQAAKNDGVELVVNSGFRSRNEQAKLYDELGPGKAAKPGTSNHEKGNAIDFVDTPGAYEWLRRNASKFGFHNNIPHEPWHYSLNGY